MSEERKSERGIVGDMAVSLTGRDGIGGGVGSGVDTEVGEILHWNNATIWNQILLEAAGEIDFYRYTYNVSPTSVFELWDFGSSRNMLVV